MLGIKLRTVHILVKHTTTKPPPHPHSQGVALSFPLPFLFWRPNLAGLNWDRLIGSVNQAGLKLVTIFLPLNPVYRKVPPRLASLSLSLFNIYALFCLDGMQLVMYTRLASNTQRPTSLLSDEIKGECH